MPIVWKKHRVKFSEFYFYNEKKSLGIMLKVFQSVVQNSIGVDRDSQPIWSSRIGYRLLPTVLDSVNLTGEQRRCGGGAASRHTCWEAGLLWVGQLCDGLRLPQAQVRQLIPPPQSSLGHGFPRLKLSCFQTIVTVEVLLGSGVLGSHGCGQNDDYVSPQKPEDQLHQRRTGKDPVLK